MVPSVDEGYFSTAPSLASGRCSPRALLDISDSTYSPNHPLASVNSVEMSQLLRIKAREEMRKVSNGESSKRSLRKRKEALSLEEEALLKLEEDHVRLSAEAARMEAKIQKLKVFYLREVRGGRWKCSHHESS